MKQARRICNWYIYLNLSSILGYLLQEMSLWLPLIINVTRVFWERMNVKKEIEIENNFKLTVNTKAQLGPKITKWTRKLLNDVYS